MKMNNKNWIYLLIVGGLILINNCKKDDDKNNYWQKVEINNQNEISYFGNNPNGNGYASGGDVINKPSWCTYNVWSVWVGGKPICYNITIPNDIKYPVYLLLHCIGTLNERLGYIPDTYLYLRLNNTVIYNGKDILLSCCDFEDWKNNRVITIIDSVGNGIGGLKRGDIASIFISASEGGTTRICVHGIEIKSSTKNYDN